MRFIDPHIHVTSRTTSDSNRPMTRAIWSGVGREDESDMASVGAKGRFILSELA